MNQLNQKRVLPFSLSVSSRHISCGSKKHVLFHFPGKLTTLTTWLNTYLNVFESSFLPKGVLHWSLFHLSILRWYLPTLYSGEQSFCFWEKLCYFQNHKNLVWPYTRINSYYKNVKPKYWVSKTSYKECTRKHQEQIRLPFAWKIEPFQIFCENRQSYPWKHNVSINIKIMTLCPPERDLFARIGWWIAGIC